MKKSKIYAIVGVFLVLFMLASSYYAVTFNESRLVVPMDFSTYVFTVKDLPMILSVVFFWIFMICIIGEKRIHNKKQPITKTRTISPWFGLLGFFGFLGFLGFYTYSIDQQMFPFVFFVFFGFFSFYYEGKMSGVCIDERFKQDTAKASLQSYKIGFYLMFATLILSINFFDVNSDVLAMFLLISFSLVVALVMFLSVYLLYRYDKENA